jgi:hypothetical protein
MQETGKGPRGLRNAINEGNVNIGKKATNFLNNKLQELGAKPLSKDERIETPPPNKVGSGQKKPGQVQAFNSGSNPFFPFQQMQAGANKAKDNKGDGKKDNKGDGKKDNKKAVAKGKAQAAKKKK